VDIWFNRQGEAVDVDEWSRLHRDIDQIVVGRTTFGAVELSTVWLGIDHGFGPSFGNPPIIFETMTFGPEPWDSRLLDRYATEQEAIAGHEHWCAILQHEIELQL
jgi:hypothetical protein